ncbi:MAG: RsmB/NOP family class I SAM-dependent RNA methyltransferase [Bacteroidota bacterium]
MSEANPPGIPERFFERLRQIVPAGQYHRVVDSFSKQRMTCFRLNPLLGEREAVVTELKRLGIHLNAVGWYPDRSAFWIREQDRKALLGSDAYRAGKLYVQNLSSMVPPLVLDPQPGERILDLTAAPGSKTTQMAGLMQNEGEIIAVEKVRNRFFKLLRNLKMQGVQNVQALQTNGERAWRDWPESFDRVLLDAPCSTEGRIDAGDPHTYKYWSERKIKEMTRKQKRLLFSAVLSTRPGGTLVYSTCSFAPEENEAIVQHALKKFGDALEIEPIDLDFDNEQPALTEWKDRPFAPEVRHARRILPTPAMEGFFVCRFRKIHGVAREP